MSEANPPAPASILADPEAREIVRAWWSRDQAVLSMQPVFNDPADFGRLLSAMARQMAAGYAEGGEFSEAEAHEAMCVGWEEVKTAPLNSVREDRKGAVQ